MHLLPWKKLTGSVEESHGVPSYLTVVAAAWMEAGVWEGDVDMTFLGMVDVASKIQVCWWNMGLLLPTVSPKGSI